MHQKRCKTHGQKKLIMFSKIKPLAHYGQIEKVSFMHQTHESTDYKYIHEYGVTELVVDNNYQNKILGTGFLNYYMPF